MGLFFVLLLIPMIIQHIAIKGYHIDYQKRNITALTFFFLLLTLLVMLRHKTIGTDTYNYISYFQKIGRMEWQKIGKGTIEIGFLFFNKIIYLISQEPQFFLAVAAVITSAMIYPTYKRLCVDASLTIVLYCIMSTFVMMFSGLRQMLAIGIGFIAYELTRRKKIVLFMVTVILAMAIHTSAFMLFFIYPIYYAKITKKWMYVVVPILAIIFVFNKPIFSFLTTIMAQYSRLEGDISLTGSYTMLILFAIFVVFAYLIPDESCMDEETVGLRNFLLLSLVLQMFVPLHMWAMRMNYYYIIFIPLLIPRIIYYRNKRWNQIAILGRHIMVTFFMLYFFMNAYGGENLNVFPYHFFWEELV